MGDRPFLVVDTGGFEPSAAEAVVQSMARQTLLAVAESDAVIFLVDAREGLNPHDRNVAQLLRESGRTVWLAVNKAEGMDRAVASAEFHELGLGAPWAISSAHGDGIAALVEAMLEKLPADEPAPADEGDRPRIAIVGRPNAGKSTLVNALLGQDRVITSPIPGTTRDSITVEFAHRGRDYQLIDTAGLRRRARVSEAVEKFSVIRALHSIEEANVAVLVIDGTEGVSDQDANIAGYVIEAGRATVVAINKCDLLDSSQRGLLKSDIERRLGFLGFARFHFVSAKDAQGLDALMRSVDEAYRAAFLKMSTPKLTRHRSLSAPAQRLDSSQAALRPPGRKQSAHRRGAWLRRRESPGELSKVSRGEGASTFQTAWYPATDRVPSSR
jgi:GTP-binding protein